MKVGRRIITVEHPVWSDYPHFLVGRRGTVLGHHSSDNTIDILFDGGKYPVKNVPDSSVRYLVKSVHKRRDHLEIVFPASDIPTKLVDYIYLDSDDLEDRYEMIMAGKDNEFMPDIK